MGITESARWAANHGCCCVHRCCPCQGKGALHSAVSGRGGKSFVPGHAQETSVARRPPLPVAPDIADTLPGPVCLSACQYRVSRGGGLRGRHPHAVAGTPVLPARSAGGALQRAGDSCAVPRHVVVAADSASRAVLRALLLRLDLSHGDAAPLLWEPEVGTEARQAVDRLESLQAVAKNQVFPAGRGAGGGAVRQRPGGVAGSFQPAATVAGPVDSAGNQLRGQRGPEWP